MLETTFSMKKFYYVPLLASLFCLFGTIYASASTATLVTDSLKHKHIEPSSDFTTVADTVATDSVYKKGFFRGIYRYFQGSNEDKTLTKKFDFSIIGGPHYSSDIKLGLGLVAAGLYRVDRNDLSIPPSNVSFFGDVTTTGFFLLGIRGNTLFKGAKYRLDFTTYFFSMPSAFWGIGYDAVQNNVASQYKRLQSQIKVDFLFRIHKQLYLGVNASFNYIEGKNFTDISYLGGQNTRYLNTGIGVEVMYDSRDFIPNAYKGIYFKVDQRFFPMFLGNTNNFAKTEIYFDAYQRLWKGGILAYDLHSELGYGKTPWTMLALMGGSYRMRGYYEGQYRDKNLIETQLELRQKIWRRIGATAWVGAGNVFQSFHKFDFAKTLPNYGFGLRWEFKKRMNVRIDYGFGKGQTGFIFGINEAF